jgi:acyl carrier protein
VTEEIPSEPASLRLSARSKDRVRAILTAKLASFLRSEGGVIDPHRPLAEYGIDSTDLLTLVFETEEQFGCRFPPSTFFDIETLDELADRIAASLTDQGIPVPGDAGSMTP